MKNDQTPEPAKALPIDLDTLPNGHRKPIETSETIKRYQIWRERSRNTKLVLN